MKLKKVILSYQAKIILKQLHVQVIWMRMTLPNLISYVSQGKHIYDRKKSESSIV